MKQIINLLTITTITFAATASFAGNKGNWKAKPLNEAETACFNTAGVSPVPATKGDMEAAKKGVADKTARKQLEKCLRDARKGEHKHGGDEDTAPGGNGAH